MENLAIILILAAVLGGAAWYIYKAKKSGAKCIGCPNSGSCGSGGCSGNCSGCSGNCSCK
jgi:hypothetical protein